MIRLEFAEIVKKFRPVVQRRVRHYFQGREEVEDLVQDTFLRAWCHRDELRDPSLLGAWLLRIAERVALTCLLKRRKAHQLVEEMTLTTDIVRGEDPEAFIRREEVRDAMDQLSEEQRSVLLMFVFGLSLAEISLRTGHPVGTLSAWIHRARKRLHELLD